MGDSTFYIHLPSNSSMDVFPKNTLAHYHTNLPTPIHLVGEWEVGLAEICYPMSWYNVRRDVALEWDIRLKTHPGHEGDITSFRLGPGVYKSAEVLLGEMERLLRAVGYDRYLTLKLNPISQRVEVHVHSGGSGVDVRFNTHLAELLGLSPEKTDVFLPTGSYVGSYTFDLNHGFYSLYVYCDLVRSRPIGDIMAPLLRSVPLKQDSKGLDEKGMLTRNEIFNHIYFLPMQKKSFQTIEVDIRDDTGAKVPFEAGKVEVTLVFRKVA